MLWVKIVNFSKSHLFYVHLEKWFSFNMSVYICCIFSLTFSLKYKNLVSPFHKVPGNIFVQYNSCICIWSFLYILKDTGNNAACSQSCWKNPSYYIINISNSQLPELLMHIDGIHVLQNVPVYRKYNYFHGWWHGARCNSYGVWNQSGLFLRVIYCFNLIPILPTQEYSFKLF